MKDKKCGRALAKQLSAIILAAVLLSAALLCGCSNNTPASPGQSVTVTVINGEHYAVNGSNKQTVVRGEDAQFEIALQKGYELVSVFGADCDVPSFKDNPSFTQKITFKSVKFNLSVSFETRPLQSERFTVYCNQDNCRVTIKPASAWANSESLYVNDSVTLTPNPSAGYRFECWSTKNFLASGGQFLSDSTTFGYTVPNSATRLYANFKPVSDTAQTIVYDFGNNVKITQNCSAMLANHPKANTLTEYDLQERYSQDYTLPSDKMLVGWQTADGKEIRLGGRIAVSDETYVTLTPLWKTYAHEADFVFSDGTITKYLGEADEVVIPKIINGREVTRIAPYAFGGGCKGSSFYLPSTLTEVADNAFSNCYSLTDVYMSDNITQMTDYSFSNCRNFQTLHLNAYLKPRYMTVPASIKCNLYDQLAMSQNKKCVLLGGSNVTYAYNAQLGQTLLGGQYDVFNLGYIADMCGYAYYDIAEEYLNDGDVFIHAPEHNKGSWCSTDITQSVITQQDAFLADDFILFMLFEGNLQLFENLTINKYSRFFDTLTTFNRSRLQASPQEYHDFQYAVSDVQLWNYTTWGGMISSECNKEGYSFNSPHAIQLDTDNWRIEQANAQMYNPLLQKGVKVCVTFPVTNRHNLYAAYQNEDNLKTQAEAYTQKIRSLISSDVVMLLTQYDAIYDGQHFSNSDYHLGWPSREKHTEKVIKALIEQLNLQKGAQ